MLEKRNFEVTELLNDVLKEDGQLRTGDNLKYHCPFCGHRKRKFEVKVNRGNPWNCWVCHKSGNGLYKLFNELNVPREKFVALESILGSEKTNTSMGTNGECNTSVDFLSAVEIKLAKPELRLAGDNIVRELPTEFKSLAKYSGSIGYIRAMRYATRRKLTPKQIVMYNIGYCSEGEYEDRIIFPSYDENHELNFFTGRSYYDDAFNKYKNPLWPRNIIGFEDMINFKLPVTMCEGALDAIAIKRNAIPLFGKTLSRRLKEKLQLEGTPEVRVVLDNDALPDAVNIAEWCLEQGIRAKIVELPGKDPNILGFAATDRLIKNTKCLDFSSLMHYKVNTQ